MYLPNVKNKKNPQKIRIREFEGLNRTSDMADNEFCDMQNMSSEAYPFLSTRKGRMLAFSQGLDIAVSDNNNMESYAAPTGIKRLASGSEFYYAGTKLFDLDTTDYKQIVKMNNNFILFPKLYSFSAVMADGGQMISSGAESFAKEFIGYSFNGSSSVNYTDHWFVIENEDGLAKVSVDTSRIITPLKAAINNGTVKVGDRLSIQLVSGTLSSYTGLTGYDENIIYIIKAITIDPYGGQTPGDFFVITCECFDRSGVRVIPKEVIISGVDLMNDTKNAILYKTVDGKIGEAYQGRLFACDMVGSRVIYSSKSDFTDWMVSGLADGGGRMDITDNGAWTGIKSFNGYLYLFKRDGLYRVMGNHALNYQIHWVNSIGCTNQESIFEYNSTLYYLNWDGIYAFDGNESVKISEKLNKGYKRGVFGAYSGKIYCSLEGFSETENEFLVYDIERKLWHKEAYLPVSSFVRYSDGLYAVTKDAYYKMSAGEEDMDFSVTTKKFFYSFEDKGIYEVRLYVELSESTAMAVEIAYDSGAFIPCGSFNGARVKRIPVKLKKCNEFQIRLSGTGQCKIMDMEFHLDMDKT